MRLIALALLVFLAGCSCGEPCEPNSDRPKCEGSVLATCPQPGVDQIIGADRWIRRDCAPRVCVASGPAGFCALSAVPNARCDGGVLSGCENPTTQLICTLGFATARNNCLRCEPEDAGTRCVGGYASTCATSAECVPELGCGANGYCVRLDAG